MQIECDECGYTFESDYDVDEGVQCPECNHWIFLKEFEESPNGYGDYPWHNLAGGKLR